MIAAPIAYRQVGSRIVMVAADEKDRFGDKLRSVEKAREDQWAAERDRELLARLRRQAEERAARERQPGKTLKVFDRILCPIDFDENSLKALDLASRLASRTMRSSICFMSVRQFSFRLEGPSPIGSWRSRQPNGRWRRSRVNIFTTFAASSSLRRVTPLKG